MDAVAAAADDGVALVVMWLTSDASLLLMGFQLMPAVTMETVNAWYVKRKKEEEGRGRGRSRMRRRRKKNK